MVFSIQASSLPWEFSFYEWQPLLGQGLVFSEALCFVVSGQNSVFLYNGANLFTFSAAFCIYLFYLFKLIPFSLSHAHFPPI